MEKLMAKQSKIRFSIMIKRTSRRECRGRNNNHFFCTRISTINDNQSVIFFCIDLFIFQTVYSDDIIVIFPLIRRSRIIVLDNPLSRVINKYIHRSFIKSRLTFDRVNDIFQHIVSLNRKKKTFILYE